MNASEFSSRVSALFKELHELQLSVDSDVQLLGELPIDDYALLIALFKEYNFLR